MAPSWNLARRVLPQWELDRLACLYFHTSEDGRIDWNAAARDFGAASGGAMRLAVGDAILHVRNVEQAEVAHQEACRLATHEAATYNAWHRANADAEARARVPANNATVHGHMGPWRGRQRTTHNLDDSVDAAAPGDVGAESYKAPSVKGQRQRQHQHQHQHQRQYQRQQQRQRAHAHRLDYGSREAITISADKEPTAMATVSDEKATE